MKTSLSPLFLAVVGALGFTSAAFAQQETENTNTGNSEVERIVVTGVPGGTPTRKVDTSFAITNMSEEDIKRLAPKSTADIFKAVPGVWAESSGGQSGANIFVRGFPGGGDAPFVTLQLQGVPVFTPPTLSFLENSSLFRMDETISFMDALRGGPNSVLSNGQPGLTSNFLLKEGSEETEGLIKYTGSDYNLKRVDGLVSGELAEDLYFMAGGYVYTSPGIRDTGFDTEDGKQFTLNITKELDNGKFSVFTRVTDDHGIWYLPSALNAQGVDNSYVQLGTLNRQSQIQVGADGEVMNVDLGKGRGWKGSVTGGNLQLDLGNGWTLADKFGYTKGDANTYGLVPEGGAVKLATVADNGESATGVVTGTEYAGDTDVQMFGSWVVLKEIEGLSNDLTFGKAFDQGKFTFGYFTSSFSSDDWWSIGNQSYYVVGNGGEMLTGIDCNDNADSCSWNYDINATGDGSSDAFYAAVDYKLTEDLTVDVGVRSEKHEVQYTVDEGLTGVVSKAVDYSKSDIAWTAGANWQFEKNKGVFFRASEGFKMPYFDDFRDNYGAYTSGEDLIQQVTQYELGYKMASQSFSLYATGFFNEVEGDTFVARPGAPAEVLTNEAYGVELDVAYYADNGFSVTVNATVQETEITASPTNQGNEAQRQPGWQVRLTPSYDFMLGDVESTVYATIFAVDDRFGDNGNTVVLEGYEQIDLGWNVFMSEDLELQLNVQNLTDEEGLTEGDPRNPSSPNGRYILPRNATFSVSYRF
ncbi:MAG: TonB-dependent receptor [Pseudomonadota bacterium]|nr:TonB-dependent receptor [Pseudomonadota bacterium]